MLQEVVHDNNFNSSETDHASMHLDIFASKSVSANTEENSIQPYPSPEFLNSLSFIKKFYPLPVGARVNLPKLLMKQLPSIVILVFVNELLDTYTNDEIKEGLWLL